MSRTTFDVGPAQAGDRLDVTVARAVQGLSRSLAHKLIAEGRVRVNGIVGRASQRLGQGDTVSVELELPPSLRAQPEEIPLDVVYEDPDLAVLDKPAGLVVHPAAGHQSGTLANALTARYPGLAGVGTDERPGIVHRLDKDTSGLMVVALTPEAHRSLQGQLADRTVERRYLALASGDVSPTEATIRAPVGRDPGDRKKMAVHGLAARPAETVYHVLERLPGFTLLEAGLRTGRTHQIRVHLAALGHPLAGDRMYGGPGLPGLDRQFLHAYRLTLRSPSTGRELSFTSPLPRDLEDVLEGVRGASDEK